MIQARSFVEPAGARGYTFWSGVPCSFLTPFINYVLQAAHLDYVGAASEGEAVAIASGAVLGGRRSVVICQNSGLGNTVNPLTSLNYPFRIPFLLIVTHRGAPGIKDEPQHELMGRITGKLLDTMEIPWKTFPVREDEIEPALEAADACMRATGRPFALVMEKGSVAPVALREQPARAAASAEAPLGAFARRPADRMPRLEAIRAVRDAADGAALIATTGMIGRELFSLGHRPNQLYVVGSMGCAAGLALGVLLGGNGKHRVVVIDGDGAALMKLGTMATIGHYAPARFVHVVVDNEAHDSTGGQATVSPTTDFAAVAAACSYRHVRRVDDLAALEGAVRDLSALDGPNLIHVKVQPGSAPNLGRPTLRPDQVKDQFMGWLSR